MNGNNDMRKLINIMESAEKTRLDEYIAKEGESITQVLSLEVFIDSKPEQNPMFTSETARDEFVEMHGQEGFEEWKNFLDKIEPYVEKVENKVKEEEKAGRTLTDDEAREIENVWWGGVDTYEPKSVDEIKEMYKNQLKTVNDIIELGGMYKIPGRR